MTHPIQAGEWMPLSAAQRSRGFLYRFDPAAQGSHNNVFTAVVHGDLARGTLARALRQLADRHPMLRARLRDRDGEFEQCIGPCVDVPLAWVDASTMGENALLELVRRDGAQAFDLDRGMLMRAAVYARGAGEHVLMLAFDHIVVDGWSYWQLLEELGGLLARDDSPGNPVADGPGYHDYVRWQQDWLASPAAAAQRSYWERCIGDGPQVLQLPTDRALTAGTGDRDEVTLTIEPELTARLHALARRHSGTLFTTLLAAYQMLLHRHAGQDDICVGAPMPGRSRAEWDRVVGDFVNPIVLRTQFDAGLRVADVLRSVRGTALRGMSNQDYPFSRLVEELSWDRASCQHAFFQTMFVFQNARQGGGLPALWNDGDATCRVRWGGIELTPYAACRSGGDEGMGLMLETIELEGGIRCAFKFDTALYDRATIDRLAGHWLMLVEGMVADDTQLVSHLPLLSHDERTQLLLGFNDTHLEYARDGLIHGLFEAQTAARPDAIALEHAGRHLSYRELNERANQLAHHLIERGVRPDDRVAICAQRTVDLVVGMLGILKAGGAYLPLDPNYPADRLAYMLADGAPRIVLTQTALRDSLPMLGTAGAPLLLLDQELTGGSKSNPQVPGLSARHLAYIIYTSGSTGQPKGVMIEHVNTVNLLAWARTCFDDSQLATTLLSTSINFDLAVFELFLPLSTGATVRLVQDLVASATTLAGTTLVNTVPSAMAAIIGEPGLASTVGTVNLAGEPLKRELVERIFASSHAQRVVNLYGPSETTTYSTWVEMPRAEGFAAHIGRPIGNTQVYILGRAGEPVPVGVTGELFIGGHGVARGYLNRPDLTAERFLPDPFSDEVEARMYRTGDLGRWRADGTIEYLGRNDFQVKIRGFRIELGEIESRLAACEGVREAVVVAREDGAGDKRLVAYVVAHDDQELPVAPLRDQLARDLPEYMIPAAFVRLAALPLTPNGKLDRQALPAPDASAVITRAYEAPVGELETRIAGIWQDLLGLAQGRPPRSLLRTGRPLAARRAPGDAPAHRAGRGGRIARRVRAADAGAAGPAGGHRVDRRAGRDPARGPHAAPAAVVGAAAPVVPRPARSCRRRRVSHPGRAEPAR
nr:amino acid adenylation domain-containing protein [Lysobacter solisilvae]